MTNSSISPEVNHDEVTAADVAGTLRDLTALAVRQARELLQLQHRLERAERERESAISMLLTPVADEEAI
jgi:hypothetical protein